jgi:hypothetical protein
MEGSNWHCYVNFIKGLYKNGKEKLYKELFTFYICLSSQAVAPLLDAQSGVSKECEQEQLIPLRAVL